MTRLRLRTQLLIATFLIICALTGSVLLIVRQAVRSEIASQVQQNITASLHAFENVQSEHEIQLSRTAAMLAELPTLKALMTTQHAPTIQDGSDPFWKLAGCDLLLLANVQGKVLGFHVAKSEWTASSAERDLNRSLESGQDATLWYADGQLYWVFLRRITAGSETEQRQLGTLAVGYQVDSSVANQLSLVPGSQIALATDDKVIASTLSAQEEAELQRSIVRRRLVPQTATSQIFLGNRRYRVASALIYDGLPTPVNFYVLLSLEQSNAFLQRLNRVILILGLSAVMLAALLLGFVSRSITHPLDNLVAGVRALAMGDYTYSIMPRGSSEVAEVGTAFSKMRAEVLAAQKRKLATERIAALGRAASSISHDLRHHLAAVVANAEFLYEADRLKLNRDQIYDEIKTASNQMLDLLDNMRELAREGNAISPVEASLDQVIRRATEAVLANPELRTRTISINASGQMHGICDPKKLERAFFNLLLNACEAAPAEHGHIEVEILSSADSFDVSIADNGSGIPSSIRDTLFDPFVSSGKPNGTGVGLATVNRIVIDHGGSVNVEKTSDMGTILHIKLPRFSPTTAPPGPPQDPVSLSSETVT
jgi:signal transduction histidine kinase